MKRIQRQRTKGWRMPPNTVYVGRPSLWGNPWHVGDRPHTYDQLPNRSWVPCRHEPMTAEEAVERFRDRAPYLGAESLRGKDLACWCPLDQPCHADVLLELAA